MNSLPRIINIYTDESCHLQISGEKVMVIGCVIVERNKARELSRELRTFKQAFEVDNELKWTKVSASKAAFYKKVATWFLDEPALQFRALVINRKDLLNHGLYNDNSHDDFYYKMHYFLLNPVIKRYQQTRFQLFLDVKDTLSHRKAIKLGQVLSNANFSSTLLNKVQCLSSSDTQLLQLTDFLLGSVSYRNRNLVENLTKLEIVNLIESRCGVDLRKSTALSETKFNVFVWKPQKS